MKAKKVRDDLKAIKAMIRLWLATNRKRQEDLAVPAGVHRNAISLFLGDDDRDMRMGSVLGIIYGMGMTPSEFFNNLDAFKENMKKSESLNSFLKR